MSIRTKRDTWRGAGEEMGRGWEVDGGRTMPRASPRPRLPSFRVWISPRIPPVEMIEGREREKKIVGIMLNLNFEERMSVFYMQGP